MSYALFAVNAEVLMTLQHLVRHGFIKFNDEGFELKTKGIKNE